MKEIPEIAGPDPCQHQPAQTEPTVARPEPAAGLPVEERVDLQRALQRIPRADRRLLLLAYVERKKHHEIAEALGVAPDAARRRVARAVKRFRAAMGPGYGREKP